MFYIRLKHHCQFLSFFSFLYFFFCLHINIEKPALTNQTDSTKKRKMFFYRSSHGLLCVRSFVLWTRHTITYIHIKLLPSFTFSFNIFISFDYFLRRRERASERKKERKKVLKMNRNDKEFGCWFVENSWFLPTDKYSQTNFSQSLSLSLTHSLLFSLVLSRAIFYGNNVKCHALNLLLILNLMFSLFFSPLARQTHTNPCSNSNKSQVNSLQFFFHTRHTNSLSTIKSLTKKNEPRFLPLLFFSAITDAHLFSKLK